MTTPHNIEENKRTALSFVEAVCLRSRMYTLNGTLEEVGAFLEGFYSGMATHNTHPAAQREAQRWFDFCQWMTHRLNGQEHGIWRTAWQALREQYPNDQAALKQIVTLYKEYQQTSHI